MDPSRHEKAKAKMNQALFASNAYVTNIAVTANKPNADKRVMHLECLSRHHL